MLFNLLLSGFLTLVELNCENLFDTQHDSLKNDIEFTPEGSYHWTRTRYWRKLNNISKEIIALGELNPKNESKWQLPSLVVLSEIENDTVMRDLTKRSLLRNAKYDYVMTNSPDVRGIDVALLYDPYTFISLNHHSIRVKPLKGMRPTRDILYVSGLVYGVDTLHVFCVHAPSRSGGERSSRPNRMQVERQLALAVDSISHISMNANILIAGDFNDYSGSTVIDSLCKHHLVNISSAAIGSNGSKGTYRYHGEWGSLDQIFCSNSLSLKLIDCFIGDLPFLLEDDNKYGGSHPKRCYLGPKYQNGYSDHLPLVAHFMY